MTVKWDVRFSEDLETLAQRFDAIDPDAVLERGVKRTANDLAEQVRFQVFSHPDIKSPASKMSPYEGGDGPPMVEQDAWIVDNEGAHSFTVRPHPQVRQRAIILEYGTVDPIEPQSADALRFTVNGVPMYADQVSGIEARGYWRAAMAKIRSEDKFEENLEDEFVDETEKYL